VRIRRRVPAQSMTTIGMIVVNTLQRQQPIRRQMFTIL
jgi:hypothetical protein